MMMGYKTMHITSTHVENTQENILEYVDNKCDG